VYPIDPDAISSLNLTATVSFYDMFTFTVTSGLTQGFVSACFTGSENYGNPITGFGGEFLGQKLTQPDFGSFNGGSCVDRTGFSLGEPIISPMFLHASASTRPWPGMPPVFSEVAITGFKFFDGDGNQVENVSFTVEEQGATTPEPGTALLLIFGIGLVGLGGIRGRAGR